MNETIDKALQELGRSFPRLALWLPLVKSRLRGAIATVKKSPIGVRTIIAAGLRALADEVERS